MVRIPSLQLPPLFLALACLVIGGCASADPSSEALGETHASIVGPHHLGDGTGVGRAGADDADPPPADPPAKPVDPPPPPAGPVTPPPATDCGPWQPHTVALAFAPNGYGVLCGTAGVRSSLSAVTKVSVASQSDCAEACAANGPATECLYEPFGSACGYCPPGVPMIVIDGVIGMTQGFTTTCP